jgi:hypothetical protein
VMLGCPPERHGREWACDRAGARGGAVAPESGAPAAPRSRRRSGHRTCPTVPSHRAQYKLKLP